MNSDQAERAAHAVPARRQLHVTAFSWCLRLFAAYVAIAAIHLAWVDLSVPTRAAGSILAACVFLGAAYWLWLLGRSVVATNAGIELRTFASLRVVPWSQIAGLREVSWALLHNPLYPKSYELALTSGEGFGFFGRRDACDVVKAMRPST